MGVTFGVFDGVRVSVGVLVRLGVRVAVAVAIWVAPLVGVGAPSVRIAGQKPPATVNLPPLIVPASGWPLVPSKV